MTTTRTICALRRSAALVALFLGAAGCVSTGRYRTLEKQLVDTRATLGGELKEKNNRLLRCDAEMVTMRARAAESQEDNKRLEVDRARLQTELASVVRDRAQLQESAESMRAALAASDRRKLEAEKRVAEFRALLAQLRSMIDAGKLKVKVVDGRMVLALPTDVLFPSGSAELSPAGQQAIAEVTRGLLTMAGRRFQVEGHTDNVPIKTARFPSNWELGAARAITIVERMVAVGMNAGHVSGASFGEFRPVAGNDTEAGRSANRRIEIVIVPDLALLPGYDELTRAVESQ